MKTLKITNQREWDELPEKFDEFTVVEIVSEDWVTVKRSPGNVKVEAWGKAKVEARGNAKVAYSQSPVNPQETLRFQWGRPTLNPVRESNLRFKAVV